jgi:H+/gluconate symporter-like permease
MRAALIIMAVYGVLIAVPCALIAVLAVADAFDRYKWRKRQRWTPADDKAVRELLDAER